MQYKYTDSSVVVTVGGQIIIGVPRQAIDGPGIDPNERAMLRLDYEFQIPEPTGAGLTPAQKEKMIADEVTRRLTALKAQIQAKPQEHAYRARAIEYTKATE